MTVWFCECNSNTSYLNAWCKMLSSAEAVGRGEVQGYRSSVLMSNSRGWNKNSECVWILRITLISRA